MNAAVQTFAIALASVAAAAAIGIGLADSTAASAAQVAPLTREGLSGQQAQAALVSKLPRVVGEQHRGASPEVTTVAQTRAARTL